MAALPVGFVPPCGCSLTGTVPWYCPRHPPPRLLAAELAYDQRLARYRFGATIRKRLRRAEPPDIGSDVPGGGAV